MSVNEDIPVCTWELIEVVLSKAIEEREDEEIIDILHWFREKSSLFHSLGEGELWLAILPLYTACAIIYTC